MSFDLEDRRLPVTAATYERGVGRLLETVAAACERQVGFPAQVEAGLRATLALFAADPELARLLAVRPYGAGEGAIRCHEQGLKRCGALLRRAAASDPDAFVQPAFLEPALIGGICWQVTRRLFDGGPERLEDLLPSLLEFLLRCYYDPEEASLLTQRAADAERPAASQ